MASTYLRKKVSQNFTVISNELIRDKNLSWKSTGFLIYLLSSADDWELNFEDLQKRKKDGLSSTQKAAEELKVAGYLKIERVRNDKGQIIHTNWHVTDSPETENLATEEPYMENPYMDKPNEENRGQRKTNSKSTSFNKKQQQPAAEATEGSGSCNLIFDKAIDHSLHQQLTALLRNVQPILAQSMLDTLAQKIIDGERNEKFKVGNALNLVAHFMNVKFDPTAGIAISRKRENERLAAVGRLKESERKAKPIDYDPAEKIKAMRAALSNRSTS